MLKRNPTKLYRTEQIRALEEIATSKYQITPAVLMERAAAAALQALRSNWPLANKIAIFTGKGNNGGDGYVLARLAKSAGLDVTIFYLTEPKELTGLAKEAALACQNIDVTIQPFQENKLDDFDIFVDAILGIGLIGNLNPIYHQAIEMINKKPTPILAIDIPSGLDANTGAVHGTSIKATTTITFLGLKQGLLTGMAKEFCGTILCDDLDLPEEAYKSQNASAEILELPLLLKHLPKRARIAHKGAFGHVLVIGGDYGMAGAVQLSAEAAAHSGAGLVSVATRPEHVPVMGITRPEIMYHAVASYRDLLPLLPKATVIAIGPGLGFSTWGRELLACVLNNTVNTPLIIDADALNILATHQYKRTNWILTPHPGEAGRLLRTTSAEIQNDRFRAVHSLQKRYSGVVVLKGSGTLIADGVNPPKICSAGNPGMASGGMGDILSGIIAALLAQGLSLSQAASLAVILHATAGDLAATELGERGLLASYLLPWVRKLIN
ncbi:MAG: NAD(P)H-hydrate dehydratase [Gammaproteobacteria bacterium]|jgi:NAD(P)H-hydrate epimerase